ncbi:MAG: hypothetical protein MOGMAGMI_01491 [Candidatus Omnitrophica bacterium]|nr:hypothetical protein [Candidatus Omnitrophota bacterium]
MTLIARRTLSLIGAAGLLVTLLTLTCGPAEATSIRINAPRIELELAPGESYSGEFVAENPEDGDVLCRLYLEDWAYLPGGAGDKQFLPAGASALSASSWITFSPAEMTVPSFGRQTVRYTVNVPQDATGGNYSVLFMETAMGTAENDQGASVQVSGRIGALFFVRVKGTLRKEGQVKAVDVIAPAGNKPLEIHTTFQNSGNTDIELGGNFLVMDPEGSVTARGQLQTLYTFPGTLERGVTRWAGSIAPGTYDILLTYDLGQGQTLVEEKTLTVG